MSDQFRSAMDILAADGQNQAEVKALAEELFQIEQSVKQRLDQGLAPDQAAPALALLKGCGAAREVVEKLSL